MGYGYQGGPFAWLWCFVWIDLLTRVYGPWASFMVISFFAFALLFALLVMIWDPNPDTDSDSGPNSGPNSAHTMSFTNMTHSHTSQSASYDAWWANVIVLLIFAVIFATPVIAYNRSPVDTDPAGSDQPKQAQRPWLRV